MSRFETYNMDGTEFKNLLDRASNFSVKEQIMYLEQARMQFWRDNLYWDRHEIYIGRGVTPHFYNRSYKDVRYEFRVQPLDNELERLGTLMPLTGEWVELNESGQLYWKAFFRLDTNEETSPEVKQVNEPQTFEELFHIQTDVATAFQAMRQSGIVNEADQWVYGRRKGAIVAVIDVLKTRNKIKLLSDAKLAHLLAIEIGTSIGERTIRDRPQYYDDLVRELKVLIK
jgi:hypothetical protein